MHKRVCVQLHTYVENVALPAFDRQQSINISYPLGPQQQTCSDGFAAMDPCWDRRTDGRTPCRFTDPLRRILCGQCHWLAVRAAG